MGSAHSNNRQQWRRPDKKNSHPCQSWQGLQMKQLNARGNQWVGGARHVALPQQTVLHVWCICQRRLNSCHLFLSVIYWNKERLSCHLSGCRSDISNMDNKPQNPLEYESLENMSCGHSMINRQEKCLSNSCFHILLFEAFEIWQKCQLNLVRSDNFPN